VLQSKAVAVIVRALPDVHDEQTMIARGNVIHDSIPWRDELLRVADRLEQRKAQQRWTERTSFLVERDIMVSAYAIRKLNEARRISDRLAAERLRVQRHELVGRVLDHWVYEFWESFDLEKSTTVELTLTALCNQIIHSFVWRISATEEDELFDGIFVSSDRDRRKCLYFIGVDLLIGLLRDVGSEDIVEFAFRADANGERYITDVVSARDRESVEPRDGGAVSGWPVGPSSAANDLV
jgi:hypothetical protein